MFWRRSWCPEHGNMDNRPMPMLSIIPLGSGRKNPISPTWPTRFRSRNYRCIWLQRTKVNKSTYLVHSNLCPLPNDVVYSISLLRSKGRKVNHGRHRIYIYPVWESYPRHTISGLSEPSVGVFRSEFPIGVYTPVDVQTRLKLPIMASNIRVPEVWSINFVVWLLQLFYIINAPEFRCGEIVPKSDSNYFSACSWQVNQQTKDRWRRHSLWVNQPNRPRYMPRMEKLVYTVWRVRRDVLAFPMGPSAKGRLYLSLQSVRSNSLICMRFNVPRRWVNECNNLIMYNEILDVSTHKLLLFVWCPFPIISACSSFVIINNISDVNASKRIANPHQQFGRSGFLKGQRHPCPQRQLHWNKNSIVSCRYFNAPKDPLLAPANSHQV